MQIAQPAGLGDLPGKAEPQLDHQVAAAIAVTIHGDPVAGAGPEAGVEGLGQLIGGDRPAEPAGEHGPHRAVVELAQQMERIREILLLRRAVAGAVLDPLVPLKGRLRAGHRFVESPAGVRVEVDRGQQMPGARAIESLLGGGDAAIDAPSAAAATGRAA